MPGGWATGGHSQTTSRAGTSVSSGGSILSAFAIGSQTTTCPARPSRLSSTAQHDQHDHNAWPATNTFPPVELTPQEKEHLLTRVGLSNLEVLGDLGEGGTSLVELVRAPLPTGRTLLLARKSTKAAAPDLVAARSPRASASGRRTDDGFEFGFPEAHLFPVLRSPSMLLAGRNPLGGGADALPLNGTNLRGNSVLRKRTGDGACGGFPGDGGDGGRARHYPFSAFDREVRSLQALQRSGVSVAFHAATFDHEEGRGFILMEAARFGNLHTVMGVLDKQRRKALKKAKVKGFFRRLVRSISGSVRESGSASSAAPSGAATDTSAPGSPSILRRMGSAASSRGTSYSGTAENSMAAALAAAPAAAGGEGRPQRRGFTISGALSSFKDRDRRSSAGAALPPRDAPAASAAATPADSFTSAASSAGSASAAAHLLDGHLLMDEHAIRYYGAVTLQALSLLHASGFVHRDVKASNILLLEGGRAVLSDYGAAAAAVPGRPGCFAGPPAGTELYMAPELVLGAAAAAHGGAVASRLRSCADASSDSDSDDGGGDGSGLVAGDPLARVCTAAVDMYNLGLMLVELATGWSGDQIWSNVVQPVRMGHAPALPGEMSAELRELLESGLLVRDPARRWGVAAVQQSGFFAPVAWERLAEGPGPHAQLLAEKAGPTRGAPRA